MTKINKISLFTATLGLLLVSVVFLQSQPAQALNLTFTVDSTGDASDASINGVCVTAGAVCTLRAAIAEANAAAGADTIEFNISGSGLKTITPTTPLPTITSPVTINGETQTGATCGELTGDSPTEHELTVFINGASLASGNLINLNSGATGSTIRGLVLSGLTTSNGDAISSAADATITCNYIGTNSAGTASNMGSDTANGVEAADPAILTITNNLISGNGTNGVSTSQDITISDNIIGLDETGINIVPNENSGISTGSSEDGVTINGNLIGGNLEDGITMSGTYAAWIYDNFIGINIYNDQIGNGGYGINVLSDSYDFYIGGTLAEERNVISNNNSGGIRLYNSYSDGEFCSPPTEIASSNIFGNFIGTNIDGEFEDGQGNGGPGITVNELVTSEDCGGIFSVYDHQIGGLNDGEGNVIADNGGAGVLVYQNEGSDVYNITIIGNSIHTNDDLGIDLASDSDSDGVADDDVGVNPLNNYEVTYPAQRANSYVNSPEITEATFTEDEVAVSYDYNANESDGSVDIAGYQLDFYANSDEDASGSGEGEIHIGSVFVDGDTIATHTFANPGGVDSTMTLSATATVLIQVPSEVDYEDGDASWFERVFASLNRFIFTPAEAAEVTEDELEGAFGYTYGSTSEFSGYVAIVAATNDSTNTEDDTLVPTGAGVITQLLVGSTLMVSVAGLEYARRRRYS